MSLTAHNITQKMDVIERNKHIKVIKQINRHDVRL